MSRTNDVANNALRLVPNLTLRGRAIHLRVNFSAIVFRPFVDLGHNIGSSAGNSQDLDHVRGSCWMRTKVFEHCFSDGVSVGQHHGRDLPDIRFSFLRRWTLILQECFLLQCEGILELLDGTCVVRHRCEELVLVESTCEIVTLMKAIGSNSLESVSRYQQRGKVRETRPICKHPVVKEERGGEPESLEHRQRTEVATRSWRSAMLSHLCLASLPRDLSELMHAAREVPLCSCCSFYSYEAI